MPCYRPKIGWSPLSQFLSLVIGLTYGVSGAEIQVDPFQAGNIPENLGVNVGDTIAWTLSRGSVEGRVREFNGAWESPRLTTGTYRVKFDQPGLVPVWAGLYGIGVTNPSLTKTVTVTVMPWTNRPPAVTINRPVDGTHLGNFAGLLVFTSVALPPEEVARVECWFDTNLIGTITTPPYTFVFDTGTNPPPGGFHRFLAKVVDVQGETAESRPVTVHIEAVPTRSQLYEPRILPGGLFAVDYHFTLLMTPVLEASSDLKTWQFVRLATSPAATHIERIPPGGVRFFRVNTLFFGR